LCVLRLTISNYIFLIILRHTYQRSFRTSEDMSLPLLLDFLSHPKVSSLAITVNTYSKTMPMDDVMKKIDLESLTIISGPPSYISAILHSAFATPSLARLSLLLNRLLNILIFPEVCWKYCFKSLLNCAVCIILCCHN
jgi:hypothetical protein